MRSFRNITTIASTSSYSRLNHEQSHLGAVSIQGNNAFTGAMVAGTVVNNGKTDITYVNDANLITPSYFDDIETTKTTTIQYIKGNWK